jgi:hypothetical protein
MTNSYRPMVLRSNGVWLALKICVLLFCMAFFSTGGFAQVVKLKVPKIGIDSLSLSEKNIANAYKNYVLTKIVDTSAGAIIPYYPYVNINRSRFVNKMVRFYLAKETGNNFILVAVPVQRRKAAPVNFYEDETAVKKLPPSPSVYVSIAFKPILGFSKQDQVIYTVIIAVKAKALVKNFQLYAKAKSIKYIHSFIIDCKKPGERYIRLRPALRTALAGETVVDMLDAGSICCQSPPETRDGQSIPPQ